MKGTSHHLTSWTITRPATKVSIHHFWLNYCKFGLKIWLEMVLQIKIALTLVCPTQEQNGASIEHWTKLLIEQRSGLSFWERKPLSTFICCSVTVLVENCCGSSVLVRLLSSRATWLDICLFLLTSKTGCKNSLCKSPHLEGKGYLWS